MITVLVLAIGVALCTAGGALAGWAMNPPERKTPELVRAECYLRAQATMRGLR